MNLFCLFSLVPQIIHGPQSINMSLNMSANFSCEIKNGAFAWKINGTLLEQLPPEIHKDMTVLPGTTTTDGGVAKNLTIKAKEGYNMTRVQCLVGVPGQTPAKSEIVMLKIQGM